MTKALPTVRGLAKRNSLARGVYERLNRRHFEVLRGLPAHEPFSAGTLRQMAQLTLLSAQQSTQLLVDLADTLLIPGLPVIDVEEFIRQVGNPARADEIATLFDEFGSDKARHNYHGLYAAIFDDLGDPTTMLEIGMGTNNEAVPSNMSAQGSPGASLRAFRSFAPNCRVFGADIDATILFQDDRIATYQVDQTDRKSLDCLASQLPDGIDLVIDDGLHAPNANLSTLLFGLSKVRPGGWIVIEDIRPEALSFWQLVGVLMEQVPQRHLVKALDAHLFCVRLPKEPLS